MKAKLSILIIMTMMLFHSKGIAQQSSLYSQYMFNGLVLNPAYTGMSQGINTTLMYRQQWSGVEGSPNTATVSIDSPVGSRAISVGGIFSQEHSGEVTRQTFYGMGAYRLALGKGKLSFGLQIGLNNYKVNFDKFTTHLPDPTLPNGEQQKMAFNVGTGLFYHTDKFYVGFSVPTILKSSLADDNQTLVAEESRSYFFNGGYVFNVGTNFKLKPNVLVGLIEGAPVQFDLNLNALFQEFIWLGVSYSLKESVTFLTQLELSNNFRLGYSYDLVTNANAGNTRGSHEIMLNIFFTGKKAKMLTPRYF